MELIFIILIPDVVMSLFCNHDLFWVTLILLKRNYNFCGIISRVISIKRPQENQYPILIKSLESL